MAPIRPNPIEIVQIANELITKMKINGKPALWIGIKIDLNIDFICLIVV